MQVDPDYVWLSDVENKRMYFPEENGEFNDILGISAGRTLDVKGQDLAVAHSSTSVSVSSNHDHGRSSTPAPLYRSVIAKKGIPAHSVEVCSDKNSKEYDLFFLSSDFQGKNAEERQRKAYL